MSVRAKAYGNRQLQGEGTSQWSRMAAQSEYHIQCPLFVAVLEYQFAHRQPETEFVESLRASFEEFRSNMDAMSSLCQMYQRQTQRQLQQ